MDSSKCHNSSRRCNGQGGRSIARCFVEVEPFSYYERDALFGLSSASIPSTRSSVTTIDVRIDNLRVFGHLQLDELARQRQVVEREFAKSKQELGDLLSSKNHGAQLSAQTEQRGRELQRTIVPRLQQTLAFVHEVIVI